MILRVPGATPAAVSARALDALGGLGSPAGSYVWHVVGLQRSIREWGLRQGWGGRPGTRGTGARHPGGGVGDAGALLWVS
jgi:hypothetical protein